MDEARLIGAGGRMPWHLPADLARFRRLTLGKPILMGRRTFESIGRALPGRDNLVVSRDAGLSAPGCRILRSLEGAVETAAAGGATELMVIGGGQVYAAMLPLAVRLYLTRIAARFSGDSWFPAWCAQHWQLRLDEYHAPDHANAYACRFQVLERQRVAPGEPSP